MLDYTLCVMYSVYVFMVLPSMYVEIQYHYSVLIIFNIYIKALIVMEKEL